MILSIANSKIKLEVDTLGAQMMTLTDSDGIQYLWEGDPKYWRKRAPNLFPFIGRLTENSYTYEGVIYPMGIHGFAAAQPFAVESHTENLLVLRLDSNEETLKQYPFQFSYLVHYRLVGESVEITYQVKNFTDKTMPFGVGGHPGFRVPMVEGEQFDDYELVFSRKCLPDRVGFTPKVYLSGHDDRFPLQDGCRIALRHELFDDDAIILKNMDREVKLLSKVSGRSITVTYPQMPYLGIWHMPKTDAPYVCIEPWSSLPARQDVVEELSCKSDMVQLAPGGEYKNIWSITVAKGENA